MFHVFVQDFVFLLFPKFPIIRLKQLSSLTEFLQAHDRDYENAGL